jgi:hypothetical protein
MIKAIKFMRVTKEKSADRLKEASSELARSEARVIEISELEQATLSVEEPQISEKGVLLKRSYTLDLKS